jgi:hypothetical protein
MASNRSDLQLVLDNRINVSKDSVGLVEISAVNANYFEVPADGGSTSYSSQILFSQIVTPSLFNTLVSKNPRIRYQVSFTVNETAGDNYPVFADAWTSNTAVNSVWRAYPLQSVCDTISLILNGSTTTINSRQVLPQIQRKLPKDWLKQQSTECPCMADNLATLIANNNGSSQQPASNYENSDGTTRGSFVPISKTLVGDNATYVWDISEPLLISPFGIYDKDVYLANVNTMSLYLNFSNLGDMIVATENPFDPTLISNFQVKNARLELTYLQVSQDVVQIPRLYSTHYENVTYFPRTDNVQANFFNGVTDTFLTQTIQSDTLRLSSLPELVMWNSRIPLKYRTGFGANPNGACTISANPLNIADTACGLGDALGLANLSVNIGTKSGQLAGASVKTIFRIAVENGYNGSWNEWCQSPVVIINPIKNLGIDLNAGDIVPGESGYVNFQFSYMINNAPFIFAQSSNNFADVETVVTVVYKGTANLTPDGCIFNLGELNHREVETALKSQPKEGMPSSEVFQPTIKAGSLFGGMRSLVGKGASAVKSVMENPLTGQVLDYLAKQKGGAMTGAGMRRRM